LGIDFLKNLFSILMVGFACRACMYFADPRFALLIAVF
jgi:hypothetical protein